MFVGFKLNFNTKLNNYILIKKPILVCGICRLYKTVAD